MDDETRSKLAELYADLDQAVAVAGPRCDLSGRCCRFAEYGHTLFLSELEAQYLVESTPVPDQPVVDGYCPYQVNGLCTAREVRPLGCRVYFCDPAYQERQTEICEEYIGRLKRLHDELGWPWSYRPLHAFLRERFGRKPVASTVDDAQG